MEQISLIERIDDSRIIVSYTAPKPKGPKGEKSTLFSNFWRVKPYRFEVSNPNNLSVSVDDFVKIVIPSQKTYLTLFFLFMFPILLFIGSYSLLSAIFSGMNIVVITLISMGFLAAGLLGYLFYSEVKRRKGKGPMPFITEIVSEKEWKDFKNCSSECASCSLCSKGENG